jgi:hypothetical protein
MKCSLSNETLVDKVDEDDIDAFSKISNGIGTSNVALNAEIINSLPAEKELIDYLSSVLGRLKFFIHARNSWWKKMIEKYGISERSKINTSKKIFYHCLNSKGEEEINFKPKE